MKETCRNVGKGCIRARRERKHRLSAYQYIRHPRLRPIERKSLLPPRFRKSSWRLPILFTAPRGTMVAEDAPRGWLASTPAKCAHQRGIYRRADIIYPRECARGESGRNNGRDNGRASSFRENKIATRYPLLPGFFFVPRTPRPFLRKARDFR